MMNPLVELYAYGQSFWYDNIRRKFLLDGTVQRLIAEDGLRGMTSNPAIFARAIGRSADYDEQIAALAQEGASVTAVYEALAIADIQMACDLFAGLYQESGGEDGYVSLEVSPRLAHDTAGTVAEAQRLFAAVNRPNLMIKVPATPAGIPAVRQLIGRGINVNVTLMFSLAHYEAVAGAYIDGLARWIENGGHPRQVASVASFFVSRVDTAVDKLLNDLHNPDTAVPLQGQVAIANAKLVYQRFREIFHGDTFAALQIAGGRRQRLLWASTSTKNPAYPDTLYVEALIGRETVNTMPPQTIEAFRDHGRVAHTLESNVDEARAILEALAASGIDLDDVTEQLQAAGVDAFSRAFTTLMDSIAAKMRALGQPET